MIKRLNNKIKYLRDQAFLFDLFFQSICIFCPFIPIAFICKYLFNHSFWFWIQIGVSPLLMLVIFTIFLFMFLVGALLHSKIRDVVNRN